MHTWIYDPHSGGVKIPQLLNNARSSGFVRMLRLSTLESIPAWEYAFTECSVISMRTLSLRNRLLRCSWP